MALKRANSSTIHDKFLVGYQGWFTCHGDGEPIGAGHHGWLHWFDAPIPDGGRPCIDLWPDVSEYSPSELFPAPGLKLKTGEQAFLFSSRHPKTVQRHFNWMAKHQIDGAFLQRFAGQCDIEAGNEGIRRLRDEVGDRVREAAEKEGRVFAIMYDVSGVEPDRIQKILERDWIHLVRNKEILDSSNYLREQGKPVVALWGFGFENSRHNPAIVRAITEFFRQVTPGGAYIVAGAPAFWRTSTNDADRNTAFLDVWLDCFDAISPWTVGRYTTDEDIDRFTENNLKADLDLLQRRAEGGYKQVDYMPVVLPGGSGFNLSKGKWQFNGIKRKGGRFLWKQIFHAKKLGVRTMYGAMWDGEYDEGTAFMPVVEKRRMLPDSSKFQFLALDEDGFEVPSDWYMRICGFAAEALRGERLIHETFPVKELQDYWATRPKYEDAKVTYAASRSSSVVSGEGSSSAASGYQSWLVAQNEDKDELPPPPYSLEAEETSTSGSTVYTSSATTASSSSRPSLSSQRPNTSSESVASLSTDFARQRLSERPADIVPPANSSQGVGPPLPPRNPHAAGPVSMFLPPQQQGRLPPRPRFDSRPAGPEAGSSSGSSSQPSPPLPGSNILPSHWPPPEWKMSKPNSPHIPYQAQSKPAEEPQNRSYDPGQDGNAVNRPHTFSASSHMHQADVHPSFKPTGAIQSQIPPFSGQSSSSPTPYATVPFPSNPEPTAQYGGGPLIQPTEGFYFRPDITSAQGPSYATPHQSPPVASYEQNSEDNTIPMFLQFPEHRHEYSSGPEYRPPLSTSPRPPQHPGMYSASRPYSETSAFGLMPNPQPGPSFSGPSNGPPPMMPPPRPATTLPYPSHSYQPTYYSPSTSSPLGFARVAVDKVAGRRAREQLENSVDNLAQTGSRLFGKLF